MSPSPSLFPNNVSQDSLLNAINLEGHDTATPSYLASASLFPNLESQDSDCVIPDSQTSSFSDSLSSLSSPSFSHMLQARPGQLCTMSTPMHFTNLKRLSPQMLKMQEQINSSFLITSSLNQPFKPKLFIECIESIERIECIEMTCHVNYVKVRTIKYRNLKFPNINLKKPFCHEDSYPQYQKAFVILPKELPFLFGLFLCLLISFPFRRHIARLSKNLTPGSSILCMLPTALSILPIPLGWLSSLKIIFLALYKILILLKMDAFSNWILKFAINPFL